jgi:hypothetical protein
MLRLILLAIVGMFVAVGVLAVALFHFWGWRGLVAFPFIILAFLWAAKFLVKNLVKKFALSLFGMKARALRGATMNIHSIKSVSRPPEREPEPDDADDEDAELEDGEQKEAMPVAEAVATMNPVMKATTKPEDPKDYAELDVTITPTPNAGNSVWEPAEFILASSKIKSLADIADKEVGSVHSVEVWNGSAFGSDDPGKYPGEQRLKIIFEVKPGSNAAWLYYYNEPIGHLNLPVGTIEV